MSGESPAEAADPHGKRRQRRAGGAAGPRTGDNGAPSGLLVISRSRRNLYRFNRLHLRHNQHLQAGDVVRGRYSYQCRRLDALGLCRVDGLHLAALLPHLRPDLFRHQHASARQHGRRQRLVKNDDARFKNLCTGNDDGRAADRRDAASEYLADAAQARQGRSHAQVYQTVPARPQVQHHAASRVLTADPRGLRRTFVLDHLWRCAPVGLHRRGDGGLRFPDHPGLWDHGMLAVIGR